MILDWDVTWIVLELESDMLLSNLNDQQGSPLKMHN